MSQKQREARAHGRKRWYGCVANGCERNVVEPGGLCGPCVRQGWGSPALAPGWSWVWCFGAMFCVHGDHKRGDRDRPHAKVENGGIRLCMQHGHRNGAFLVGAPPLLSREDVAGWLTERASTEPFTVAKSALRIAATDVLAGAVEARVARGTT